ncbi:MFS transporter [Massilia sp.]|uniref:MFS transporter n=1 Tax=Massilia sp. TaxID=1882437 RepID=UPI00352F37D5
MNKPMDATIQVEAPVSRRLSIGQKLLFGSGQVVEASITFVAATFLLYYLTNVCGLDPAVAGMVLFVSLVVDAIADPLIGSASDRLKSRWGRRLPFMIAALPILTVAGCALFMIPTGYGSKVTLACALAANIVLRLGTSCYALPYSSLTAELTSDYNERSSIAAYRALFNFVGAVACVMPAFQLIFNAPGQMSSAPAYAKLGLLLAGVVLVAGLICVAGIWKIAAPRTMHEVEIAAQHKSVASDVRDLLRNRSFVLLFVIVLVFLIASGSLQALNLYVYKYYWHLAPDQTQSSVLALQIGGLIGIPIAALMLKKMEKRTVMIIGILIVILAQGLPWPLREAGLLVGVPHITVVCSMSAGFGLSSAMLFICAQSMLADAIDEHEHLFGTRCEGLYYSSVVFASKAAVGIGSLLAGVMLAAVGLKGAENAITSPQLSESSAQILAMLWGPGHALLFLIVIPLLMGYRIDRKEHNRIIAALAARHSN